jgi:DNA-directed RNA polymerase subunit RPC12/RpoP
MPALFRRSTDDTAQQPSLLLRLLWKVFRGGAAREAVTVFCPTCQYRVVYPKRPTWCAYCGAELPAKPIIDPGLPPKEKAYKLSMNDRRFLASIRICQRDDTTPEP